MTDEMQRAVVTFLPLRAANTLSERTPFRQSLMRSHFLFITIGNENSAS